MTVSLLSAEDKQKIREAEQLKKEVRKELQEQPEGLAVSAFFKHQAVLLILGFVFTTCVGSWLTYYWKKRESANEQSRLARQELLQKQYKLIDSVIGSVSQTNTAAEDVLENYPWTGLKEKEIQEIKGNWIQRSREWRVKSKVLRQNLAISFSNSEILGSFEKIIEKRRQLGRSITNLLAGETAKEAKDDHDMALKLINDMDQMLRTCGGLMADETRKYQ